MPYRLLAVKLLLNRNLMLRFTSIPAISKYFLAFHSADFRWLWIGGLGGHSAYWGLIVVRGVLVLQVTDSPSMVGITTFAAMAPRFVTPPLAGYFSDRYTRRTVLLTGYIAQILHSVLLTSLGVLGVLGPWIIILLAVFNGAVRSFQMTATQSLIPNVVPKEHLLNAVSLNMISTHGSKLLGPGLMAIPLIFWSATWGFAICGLLYMAGLIGILCIKARTTGGIQKGTSFGASQKEAIIYIYKNRSLRTLFLLIMLHCSLTMAYESILPIFAKVVLDDPVSGVSYLMMGVGTGSVLFALYVAGMSSARLRGSMLLVLGALSGLSLFGLALSDNFASAIFCTAIMGGSQVGFMAIANSMVQTIAPDELRGRITGLNQINIGGTMAVLNLFNGIIAGEIGPTLVLITWGVLFSAVVIASLAFPTPRALYAGRT